MKITSSDLNTLMEDHTDDSVRSLGDGTVNCFVDNLEMDFFTEDNKRDKAVSLKKAARKVDLTKK